MPVLAALLVAAITAAPGYPGSLPADIEALESAGGGTSDDPALLVRLATLYLRLGRDFYTDPNDRRAAYGESARLSRRAIDLDQHSAEPHYLYAAAIGSAAELDGMVTAMFSVNVVRAHAAKALELDPEHARTLHLMGMLLGRLPAHMGGDREAALGFLQHAVAADTRFTRARLDLAHAYLDAGRIPEAIGELDAILRTPAPRDRYNWQRTFAPEAKRLLAELNQS